MNIFKNKFLVKLIATICLFLTLVNFSGIGKVYAADDEVPGGVLIKPVINLLTALSDSIMALMHHAIMKQDTAMLKISEEPNWVRILKVIAVGVFAMLVTAACAATVIGVVAAVGADLAAATAGTFTVGMKLVSATLAMGLAVGGFAGYSVRKRMD